MSSLICSTRAGFCMVTSQSPTDSHIDNHQPCRSGGVGSGNANAPSAATAWWDICPRHGPFHGRVVAEEHLSLFLDGHKRSWTEQFLIAVDPEHTTVPAVRKLGRP